MTDDPKNRDLTDDDLTFAAAFPDSSRADWMTLVESVLKGAPFDAKLVSRTYDNLRIEPLYERAAGVEPLAGRAPGAPWHVMQRVDHPDAAIANRQALEDLEGGATGLALVFAGSLSARGFGLAPTADALKRALDGVILEAGIAIDFDIGAQSKDMPHHFAALVKARGLKPPQIEARFNYDPIGAAARAGASSTAWSAIAPIFAGLCSDLARQGFNGPMGVADGRVIHEAGGSEAQELAFVLAVAVAYLRALEASGLALEDARKMIGVKLAADANQFMTMAKFRALRKLWSRIEIACGLAPTPLDVSAETGWRMMTRRDPYVNMLRATIATAAASFGGANAITVLPHTLALGLPDAATRRMARNIQLVLLEESNLARVADPAAGSGGIEDLTAKLCQAAWSLFQDIEKTGGIWTALETNGLQQKVAAVRTARDTNIARCKDALTGVSEFPDIHEAPVTVLTATPVVLPPMPPASMTFDALAAMRLAAPFEALRDASDVTLAATGSRPRVFLANLGSLADFTPRATFAKNMFEAGGIEAVEYLPSPLGGEGRREASGWGDVAKNAPHPRPLPTASGGRGEDLVTAFNASGARLVCLCSTDEIYARNAEATAKALAAAGATHIYLAGRPGDHETAFKAMGIGTFVYAGIDVLATLKAAHAMLNQARTASK